MNELVISLDRKANKPLYEQIYHQIKQDIITGNIQTNTALPSIRKLSQQLQVNKSTLEAAYAHLAIEGLIESQPRSGFYVKEVDYTYFRKQHSNKKVPIEKKRPNILYDFNLDHVDVDHFPLSTWRKLLNRTFSYESIDFYNSSEPQGNCGLRKEIAKYVSHSRGVKCSEDQIIIGAHSQVLLMLVSNLLELKGKSIAVGEPGYSLATYTFEQAGCKIKPISMEKEGFNEKDLEQSEAQLVFTSPSFQFPFGNIMTIQKRIHLLKWAGLHNAYIIEDDYLSEFRYSGELIPSLQSLDYEERVVYMGTFHSTLLPTINIGYIVLPLHLLDKYNQQPLAFQQTTSRIEQKTLELFMKNGHWEHHRFKMKEIYRKKYEATISAIHDSFQGKAKVWQGQTGLHVVMELALDEDEHFLKQKAKEVGINIVSLSECWYNKENNPFTNPIFLLGFGGLTIEEIQNGVTLLAKVWLGEK